MRRDFSESSKKTLLDLIDEVNNGGIETIFDYFGVAPDIENYLNDLNSYHKKVIDKNNTTADQINRIFDDVDTVDLSYQSIFDNCCKAVTEQIDYIKGLSDCINPLKSNFTVEHIEKTMQSRLDDVYWSTVNYYKAKLIHSDGDGYYDYDYFRKIMSMNPEDIPEEMYVAMIDIFNDMDTEEKEQFINSSYIYVNPNPGSYNTLKPSTEPQYYLYEYRISDVFKKMITCHDKFLFSDNESLDKYLYNYNIMNSIAYQCNSIYVTSGAVRTSIRNPEDNHIDFTISFNGRNSPNYTAPLLSIDGYYKRNGQSVSNIFAEHAADLVESLKDNGSNTLISLADTVVSATITSDVIAAPYATVLSSPIGISMTILGTITNYQNILDSNIKIDDIKILLSTGNFYEALAITDCCFSVREDGQYFISYFEEDKETLHWRLEAWKYYENANIDYDENDIIEALRAGDLSNLEELQDFVTWCTMQDGIEKAEEHRKEHSEESE